MPPFLFGASVGVSGTASKGDDGGARGTVSTVGFLVKRLLISLRL